MQITTKWTAVLGCLLATCLVVGGCGEERVDQGAIDDAVVADSPFVANWSAGASFSAMGGDFDYEESFGYRAEALVEESEAEALPATWKRSNLVPNASRLLVGENDALPLEATHATVEIDGFRARVVLDLFHRNTHTRQLEGDFRLRLPDGASPYYLAFGPLGGTARETTSPSVPGLASLAATTGMATSIDAIRTERAPTWRQPREARVVPREEASRAYRETVRRQVDPALLEWAGAGVFSAKVFPLEPRTLHRIVVGYEVDLVRAADGLHYRLELPEDSGALEVRIAARGGEATVTPAHGPEANGSWHWKGTGARRCEVHLDAPAVLRLQGEDPATGAYFATRFRPAMPRETAATSGRAIFLVDTSLSSDPDRMNVWLALLEAILEENRESTPEFALAFFGLDTTWWRQGWQPNTKADVEAALAAANDLVLEGATDLAQALRAARGLEGEADVFLLSDGAATWGEDDLDLLAGALGEGRPLFAYATGQGGTNRRDLDPPPRAAGGAVFSVVGEADVAAAATAHTARPWRLASVAIDGGEDLLVAGDPRVLFPGQVLTVAGRGAPEADAPVRLTLRRGEQTKTVSVTADAVLASDLAPRVYGNVAVERMEALAEHGRELAAPYALHFRVPGRTCSLVMLDRDEDYEQFAIDPQANAEAVAARPAATWLDAREAEAARTAGDPKARLLAWLDRLEGDPSAAVRVPSRVREALAAVPSEAFRVVPEPLAISKRTKGDVPAAFRAHLGQDELSWSTVWGEAERRLADGGAGDALRALSSLVERSPGDLVLAREVAYAAMDWDLGGQAWHLFRRVAERRPYEPDTWHAMALCAEQSGKPDLALALFEVAVNGEWPDRFGDARRIVAFDYLRFLRRAEREGFDLHAAQLAGRRVDDLAGATGVTEADLVAVIAWSTDRTDVDLHVTDPRGEDCYYENPRTGIGGWITADVTQGFGPEMFVLERAVPGRYDVNVHYFASDQNRTHLATRVRATVYEDWGRPNERVVRKTVALGHASALHGVATLKR